MNDIITNTGVDHEKKMAISVHGMVRSIESAESGSSAKQ
jgi:hypothetical protein